MDAQANGYGQTINSFRLFGHTVDPTPPPSITPTPTPTPTPTTIPDVIQCNSSASFSGGAAMPSVNIVALGSNLGDVTLTFQAFGVPDRFVVKYGGEIVIDTGYRGSATYNSQLAALGLTPVVGPGSGTATFNKTSTEPYATVEVYGPFRGTAWNFSMSCPVIPAPSVTSYEFNSIFPENQNSLYSTVVKNGTTYGYVKSEGQPGDISHFHPVSSLADNLLKFTGKTSKGNGVLILNEYYTSNALTNEKSTLIRCFRKVDGNMEVTKYIDVDANEAVTILSDDGDRLGVCYVENGDIWFRLYVLNEWSDGWSLVNNELLFQTLNATSIDVKSDLQLSTLTISYKQNNKGYTHIFSIDSLGNLTPRNNVIVNNEIFDRIYSIPINTLGVGDFICIGTVNEKANVKEFKITTYDYINNQYIKSETTNQIIDK